MGEDLSSARIRWCTRVQSNPMLTECISIHSNCGIETFMDFRSERKLVGGMMYLSFGLSSVVGDVSNEWHNTLLTFGFFTTSVHSLTLFHSANEQIWCAIWPRQNPKFSVSRGHSWPHLQRKRSKSQSEDDSEVERSLEEIISRHLFSLLYHLSPAAYPFLLRPESFIQQSRVFFSFYPRKRILRQNYRDNRPDSYTNWQTDVICDGGGKEE